MGVLLTAGGVSTGIASSHETPSGKQSKVAKGGVATGRGGMVFVQSNDPKRNSILAFRRAADGKLTAAGEYLTGGRGGAQKDNPRDRRRRRP